MRVADYIASFFADRGCRHVFGVTGGGAMHLNDAFGEEERLHCIYNHHEQASAMAAESYARLSGHPAVVNVTTGPGGINALNGVYGAWTDSVPMIIVSGQVKRETCMAFNDVLGLRQLGDQEVDIIGMVRGITKFAETVREPSQIRKLLEEAWYQATTGRPGPVWLDVPIDVQGADVEPDLLMGFDPPRSKLLSGKALSDAMESVRDKVSAAKRPVILVGGGIRAAKARDQLLELVEKWRIPVVTAWNAHDVVWDDHPLYAGRPGTIGDRAGNFAVQNSDLLLVLGSRLNIRQIGYAWPSFARAAFKIWIDADDAELRKPTVRPDLAINADLADALRDLVKKEPPPEAPDLEAWRSRCSKWRERYPVVLPEYRKKSEPVNPYIFVEKLFESLEDNEIVVCADGTACVVTFQAARLKKSQRLYTNSGSASMGYDLPAAIGAAVASGRRVVCLAGDGSIQMNLQELQTIKTNHLPIKIFILNNGGYHSIKQTQANFFGRLHGCDATSGVECPDAETMARAYGFPYTRVAEATSFDSAIKAALSGDGAAICEVVLDPAQPFSPKQSSRRLPDGRMVSAPLEDLAPFLERDELAANMLIPLWDESETALKS
jgi:acetolactate synthase-1/2/3 large subunit